ncbi:uncharacterized protein LOC134215556 [Armigeres subalbatus]|uniref:uncharacterized protein LOC134215556 n=1 Tax=Armigeres subalbatus TaxID=124917 RepID=UPI002ED66AEA
MLNDASEIWVFLHQMLCEWEQGVEQAKNSVVKCDDPLSKFGPNACFLLRKGCLLPLIRFDLMAETVVADVGLRMLLETVVADVGDNAAEPPVGDADTRKKVLNKDREAQQ